MNEFDGKYINAVKNQCDSYYDKLSKLKLNDKDNRQKDYIKDIKKNASTIYKEMEQCALGRQLHATNCFKHKTDNTILVDKEHEIWYQNIRNAVKSCKDTLSKHRKVPFSRPRSLKTKHSPLSQSKTRNKTQINIPQRKTQKRSKPKHQIKSRQSRRKSKGKKKRSSYK